MEYKNEQAGVSFSVPDKITVRQQMAYHSRAALAADQELFIQLWLAARTVIQDWKCETVPLDIDIDTATDPQATLVLMWAGSRVSEYINKLETIAKNS